MKEILIRIQYKIIEAYNKHIASRLNGGHAPVKDFEDILRENVLPVCPEGTRQVHLTDGSITSANESALTVALLKYARDHNLQDVSSLCVLGFENGFHGNSLNALSSSDPITNVSDSQILDWPLAPFPDLKYPLAPNEHHNAAEEERSLDAVRKIIRERRDAKKDVGAIIIEPITAYNNKMATPNFYRKLRQIALENEIPFVVDETRTGVGISGKMWAHEYWFLKQSADIVTFGGKTGLSGYFSTLAFTPSEQDQLVLGQHVDLEKMLHFGKTWKYIQRKNLLNYVNDTSTFLKIELERVNKEKGIAENIRGNGTFIGFDVQNEWHAVKLQQWLFRSGIHLLRCGPVTFGLRPSLILGPRQAAVLRESLFYYSPMFE